VCDGASTDGSVEIIRRHEARIARWRSEPDSGPAEALNKGFTDSTGDVMGWLNSDDLLMPGAVRHVASYFARHPEVDAVYGHRVIVDDRDWQVGRWVLPRHDGRMLLWGDYIPQETLFWRRSLWDRVGARLDETFKFAFDWDLLLRFEKAGARIVRLPWFLGCFRVHDAQKSTFEISTTGMAEMARLRERELGSLYSEDRLGRKVILFQHKAVWCDRLLRWGVRW
jgi:glycosyltransferase involved in cell wall biosynthesis